MRYATNCRCHDPLVFDDEPEHCFRCGRGPFQMAASGRARRRRRLPWDLGALHREGRRPDPHLENVVRLDRLRDQPRAPQLHLVETLAGDDWPELRSAA